MLDPRPTPLLLKACSTDTYFGFLFILLSSGIKVYTTEEKELIMEPVLKWAANPNVTLSVKAFGLKATAQVLTCYFTNEENEFKF